MRIWPGWRAGLLALVAAVTLSACSAVYGRGGPGDEAGREVVTSAELAQHPEEDLLTFMRRARPVWLQARPARSAQGQSLIVVVLDGVPQEPGLDLLRGIRVSDVQELRRLNASDATTRFGTGMTAGAILVTTKH